MLKWIVPGAITVLCGTSIAVAMTGASIEPDLLSKGQGALSHLGYSRADLHVDGRPLLLTGTAAGEIEATRVRLAAVQPIFSPNGQVAVIAPLIKPYQWHAKFHGQGIELSGYVPDFDLSDPYRTAALDTAVATGISGAEIGLTGAPPTAEMAEDVVTRLAQAGSIVVLEPPRVEDYWVSANLQPGGTLVFDGYAPDQGTRDRFAAVSGADVTWLRLGRGEPERYSAHVDFGLAVLAKLAEGRFSLRENVAVVTGSAATATDYLALRALHEQGPPEGMVLAMFDVKAPVADPYRWQVSKAPSGDIGFEGNLPNPDVEASLSRAAGIEGLSGVSYASGEPANFLTMAETAVALLDRFSAGSVEFDGRGWTLTGTPKSLADRAAIGRDFAARQLAASGWSMAIATRPEPVVEPRVEEPVSEPSVVAQPLVTQPAEDISPAVDPDPNYAFSIDVSADGTAVVAGQVPAPATLQFVSDGLAGANIEAVSVAAGAPATFGVSLQSGLRALALLTEGALDFSGGRWQLRGTAPSAEVENAVTALLGADPGPWDMEIVAAAQAVVEAQPAEPVATATAPAGADLCEAALADFSRRNGILFQSGAAIMSTDSEAALDELAGYLATCPEALVHVEGHTDSDGDETLNLALSVARAEAVVAALIERGVAPRRLYALGFGEASPIASNDTADGKRQNRRIVVKLAGGNT